MSFKHILAVGAFALVASAYACGQATAEDSEEAGGAFVGFKGSVDQAGIVEVTTIMLTTASNPLLDSSLDNFNQEDPFALPGEFRTAFAFTRVTARAVRDALLAVPELAGKVPCRQTVGDILDRLGYRLRRVLKARPAKKPPRPTPSSPTSRASGPSRRPPRTP